MIGVAAFDVDGTITARDCVVPFLRQIAGTASLTTRMLRHPVSLTRAGLRRDRDALKAASVSAAFRGRSVDEVRLAATDFARSVYDNGLRSDVLEMLRAHQATGDVIVLVSASFEVYLDPLGAQLGVDGVLATRLQVGPTGQLTGALEGPNCRGPEKVVRLDRWLVEHFGGRDHVHVTAYGDSPGDRELLAAADSAHWVGK